MQGRKSGSGYHSFQTLRLQIKGAKHSRQPSGTDPWCSMDPQAIKPQSSSPMANHVTDETVGAVSTTN